MQRTFEQYAEAGASHDVLDALRLLSEAYVMECGVSLGNRTVVYYAAEVWQEKLAWFDLELSEIAREATLADLMPLLSDSYAPECNEYDITGMKPAELIECCNGIIHDREFNEATLEVLCYGIHEHATKPDFVPFEVSTEFTNGVVLKGICQAQCCATTLVEMTEPFKGLVAAKQELVREPEMLLFDLYVDYTHLQLSEEEARGHYEEYKARYQEYHGKSSYRKIRIFDEVYGPLLIDSVISCPEKVLHDMYGLEFYDSFTQKDPSWYTLPNDKK